MFQRGIICRYHWSDPQSFCVVYKLDNSSNTWLEHLLPGDRELPPLPLAICFLEIQEITWLWLLAFTSGLVFTSEMWGNWISSLTQASNHSGSAVPFYLLPQHPKALSEEGGWTIPKGSLPWKITGVCRGLCLKKIVIVDFWLLQKLPRCGVGCDSWIAWPVLNDGIISVLTERAFSPSEHSHEAWVKCVNVAVAENQYILLWVDGPTSHLKVFSACSDSLCTRSLWHITQNVSLVMWHTFHISQVRDT